MVAGDKASGVSDGFTLSTMEPKEINNLARQFVVQYYTVSGEISKGGSDYRRFAQSFALSEQAPCDFYVVSDIFKYQDIVYGDVKPETQVIECNGVASSHSFGEEPVKGTVVSQNAEVNASTWKNQAYNDGPQQPETVVEEHTLNEPDEITILSEPVNTVTPSPVSQESSISPALQSPPAEDTLPQRLSWAQMASQQAAKPTGRAYISQYHNNDDKHQARHVLNVHGQVNPKARASGQRQLLNEKSGTGDQGQSQDTMATRQVGPARIGSGGRGFSRGGRTSGGRGGAMSSGARMPNAIPAAGFGSRRS